MRGLKACCSYGTTAVENWELNISLGGSAKTLIVIEFTEQQFFLQEKIKKVGSRQETSGGFILHFF